MVWSVEYDGAKVTVPYHLGLVLHNVWEQTQAE